MRHKTDFTWRRVRLADASAVLAIYNESVEGGGHSPVLKEGSLSGMEQLILTSQREGWPMWVLLHGEEIVGWSLVQSIVWGADVCRHTGDLWLYLAEAWHGSGAAMCAIRNIYAQVRRFGFEAITCWILGGNRKSSMVARACRMKLWGRLPGAARHGDRVDDLEIWGVRFDDAEWCAYMDALHARHERLRARQADTAPAAGFVS